MTTTMTGSAKQVVWAGRLRSEYLATLDRCEALADQGWGAMTAQEREFVRPAIAQLRTEALSQTSARWWIDGRDTSAIARLNALIRSMAGLPAIDDNIWR